MNNKIKILYISTVILLSGFPILSMPILKLETVNNEKREYSEFPSVYSGDKINMEFFNEFDEYLFDNFNFRNKMVEINTILHDKLFGISAESQVIKGDDDWLFFEKTSEDYTRINTLSEIEIQQIQQCISLMNEFATLNGSEFRFTIAPNKNSIYPEKMPRNYIQQDIKSNMEMVKDIVDEDVYVNMYKELSKSEEQVYLKRDSHWNSLGAYLGFGEIMESYNLDIDFSRIHAELKNEFVADLEQMMYPTGGELDEEIYYTFDRDFTYTSRFKTMDDLSITTVCEEANGTIMVYRDSFGNALLDYFARQFNEVEFSRVIPYRLDKGVEFEYILLEIVERNIPNLLENAPVMEAIVRDDIKNSIEVKNSDIIIEEIHGFYHIYGITDEIVTGAYAVYMTYDDIMYELFPILENSLNEVERNEILAFSGYIKSESMINKENIKISYRKI